MNTFSYKHTRYIFSWCVDMFKKIFETTLIKLLVGLFNSIECKAIREAVFMKTNPSNLDEKLAYFKMKQTKNPREAIQNNLFWDF